MLILQACAVYIPAAQSLVGTTDLTATDWITAAAIASSMLWIEELRKAARTRLTEATQPAKSDRQRRTLGIARRT
ncbi:hypothetical protein GCM10027521_00830 [Amycolatopsis cihanbeyliensis]